MIEIICNFLGIAVPDPEITFVFGCVFLLYLISEFMSFLWSMYKAVFRRE